MRKFLPALILAVIVVTGLVQVPASATEAWHSIWVTRTPEGGLLRGFGHVETEYAGWQAGTQTAWVLTFRCQGPEKAAALAGKYLADLGLSPEVLPSPVKVGAETAPAWVAPGGAAYLACVEGAVARVVCAPSLAALGSLLQANPALAQGAVAAAAYPAFLDRFDRYGWGLYGFSGFRDEDWAKVLNAPPDATTPKNPVEDLDWLAQNGFRFEAHLDPVAFLTNGDGLIANTGAEWQVKEAAARGLNVSFRVYGSMLTNSSDWMNRRFADLVDQPAEFLERRQDSYSPWCQLSWFAPETHLYEGVKAMEQLRLFTDAPNVMGWMHPYGEFTAGSWEFLHSDYSVHAQNSWRRYLRDKGLDLATVSHIYERESQPYGDWDQVMEPEFATFAGLEHQVCDLHGEWWYRVENPMDTPFLDPARPPAGVVWKPDNEMFKGLAEQWWKGPVDASVWKRILAPGGEEVTNLYWRSGLGYSVWFRRSFTLTADQLATTPIYLYFFPISSDHIHSGEHGRFHGIYVNGEKAGEVGTWGALDVTKLLKAGDNEVALHVLGNCWQGRVFLSTEAPRIYPYLGEAKNRLWVLWMQWQADSRLAGSETVLDGMRQVDPNRPIKFMAPGGLGSEQWIKMAHDYGGFAHFTGEGMWFFPWYKRYAYLYDLPGSSETAGPPDPAHAVTDQFASYRRVFLEGLNAHDPVFDVEWYTRNPALRHWWEDHNPVLKQLGKYDLYGPQVLLYRSTKDEMGIVPDWQPYPTLGIASRAMQRPWDWDLGRGTLQTLGQSYVYLDDTGVADGKMNGYGVMMDCGNEFMPDETIDHVKAWVEAGGTFVTLPFTGRNSLTEPDGWHIQRLTGCGIGTLRTPGTGTVTFKADQSVFKAEAGKSFPDAGISEDYIGNNHNILSVELKPGPDCEVLATFDNGAPAIVKHKLGQGYVIALGTAFWRNVHDIEGLWWVQPIETDFIADLLAGIGYPAAPGVTDDRLIWPQPYRSNNGLDLVTVLVSWHDDKDADTTLRLRLPRKPVSLVCFGVDGVKSLPFEWKNGEAVTRVHMPAKEVKVVRATGVLDPFDVAAHWWNYQQRLWHPIVQPHVDFTPYTRGRWADPTLDLRQNALLTATAPKDDTWMQPGFNDAGWTVCPMSILNFWGAPASQPVWVRRRFTVPAGWQTGGQLRLIVGAMGGHAFLGNAKVYLNGTQILDGNPEVADLDVDKLLVDGENVLAFAFKGDQQYQGFTGQVYLYHRPAPVETISLAGLWRGTDAQGQPGTVNLPGKGLLASPTWTLPIPKEWEGKYSVHLYMEGHRYQLMKALINGKTVLRWNPYDQPADFDITYLLKYGEENKIVLNPGWSVKEPWDIRVVRLDLFPAAEPAL